MQRRTWRLLLVVGLLLGAGTMLAANNFSSNEAVNVSNGVTVSPSYSDFAITIEGTTQVNLSNASVAPHTMELNMSEGNITLAAQNGTAATVWPGNITGTYTNVSEITAGGTWIEVYPDTKQRVDVRGDLNKIGIRSMTVDDGTEDFFIKGTDGGTGTVKIYNLPANTQIVATDANGGYLDHNTSTASGTLTLDIGLSSKSVSLQSNDNTEAAKHINPDPPDGGEVTSEPSELSIDIRDQDFADGDEVQVNISLDGSQIHTENITQNATVSTSNIGNLDLGEHTWTVNSTDAYGNFNSTSYTFSLPSNITLRNETNASQVITDKNITATFYSTNGEIVVQRSDSDGDGNISLEGLPNTAFVVTFSGDGWYDRRVYIDSIFEQESIYLLNSTAYPNAVDTTFVYEDRTDQFAQDDTTLEVQRAVDVNNDDSYEWATIAGDFWGAAGEFPFTGQYQQRYRLVITNRETGDRRILGTHIPRNDGVKNIIVGDIIFDASNRTGRWFDAGINDDTNNLQAVYRDPTNGTTDLTITVYEQGNKSNEIYNQTFAGPLDNKTVFVGLTDNETDTNWVIEFDGQHQSGDRVFGQIITGGNSFKLPIGGNILASFVYVLVTFVMALYGPRTALAGAWAAVGVLGFIMVLQFIHIPVATLTVAMLVAAGGTFYREAMPG